MGTDESGWADDDPEYLMARIRGIVDSMAAGWRGHQLTEIEVELRRRLSRLGDDWPPELVEHLVRHIRDPRWPLKHPLQALDLGRRFQRRAGELPG